MILRLLSFGWNLARLMGWATVAAASLAWEIACAYVERRFEARVIPRGSEVCA